MRHRVKTLSARRSPRLRSQASPQVTSDHARARPRGLCDRTASGRSLWPMRTKISLVIFQPRVAHCLRRCNESNGSTSQSNGKGGASSEPPAIASRYRARAPRDRDNERVRKRSRATLGATARPLAGPLIWKKSLLPDKCNFFSGVIYLIRGLTDRPTSEYGTRLSLGQAGRRYECGLSPRRSVPVFLPSER